MKRADAAVGAALKFLIIAVVAEGEFTFVALDEAGKPREIAAEEEKNG